MTHGVGVLTLARQCRGLAAWGLDPHPGLCSGAHWGWSGGCKRPLTPPELSPFSVLSLLTSPCGGLSLPRALGSSSQGCQIIPPPIPSGLKGIICIWLQDPWTGLEIQIPRTRLEADIFRHQESVPESLEPRALSGPTKATRYLPAVSPPSSVGQS